MSSNSRAMAAGKEAMALRTAWMLEVGGQRFRCVLDRSDGIYAVQMRVEGRWVNVRRMRDPFKCLISLANAKEVTRVLRRLGVVGMPDVKEGP